MGTTSLDTISARHLPVRTLRLSGASALSLLALAAIVALAAALRFANLDALGYANHYYTAGVASMLQSWHNFFFVAAEPGGAVSIDKPPVGLWLQAISAYFLGVNGLAMVLPEIVCGLLSVAVLYHLVRRSFGTAAGLLAALALAITPIVVATDRNNTIDSSLILTVLLATWAFVKATENGRLRYLLLGALLFTPGIRSELTMLNTSDNQSLPSAYSGQPSGPANGGDLQVNQTLLDYLEANTQDTTYLMAVPSSMQGADYVIATGRPVLYLGGFMGQDEVVTAEDLAQLMANGELRYVYWDGQGGGRGFGSQSDISTWVTTQCTPVEGFETVTRNAGAPDGTGGPGRNTGNGFPGFADMQVSLYDCSG